MREFHDIPLWAKVSQEQWADWHWQMQNVITTAEDLERVINLSEQERQGVQFATQYLRMRISPHIATLMDPDDPHDSLRRQFVPSAEELESADHPHLYDDVNKDDSFSPVEGLVHRYPTKVLLLPSNYCGAYCRYCFRRKLARDRETALSPEKLEAAFQYITDHPGIEEVILSGGDPLVLGDKELEFILGSVAQIPHVHILRLHTRMPVSIPYRITPGFVAMLTRYKPIYVVIHVDTVREISEPMREAIAMLVDNGIPCLASCPLLRGVNDSETTLRTLWTELVKLRVKPYYLFQSDPVRGLRHFLVPIARGLEIMYHLYDRMSGLAMPQYCFNVPGGGGHILLAPNYVTETSKKGVYKLRTFEGEEIEYVDEAFEEAK